MNRTKWPLPRTQTWVATAAVGTILAVSSAPIFALFVKVIEGGSVASLLSHMANPRLWHLLWNSLLVASGSAIGAGAIGVPAGYALGYIQVPAKRFLCALFAVPVLVPPYVLATAWLDILGRDGFLIRTLQTITGVTIPWAGPYNVFGTVFILTTAYFPIVVFSVWAAFHRYDVRLEEAARLAGQKRYIFRGIVLPVLVPAIGTGVLAVFVLSLLNYTVPSLLQINTYPVEIHASSAMHDYASALTRSVPLLVLCLAALAVWGTCFRRRYAWLSGAQRSFSGSRNPWVRGVAAIYCWSAIGISVVVPFGALFIRSLPLSTYVEVWRTARGEFAVTMAVASVSALILTILAFLVSVLVRSRRVYIAIQAISLVPFGLAGPLLGLGLIALWNHRGLPGIVYDSLAIVVLALVARFLVLANAAMALGYRRLDRRLEEAARIAGVSWWRIITNVVLPLHLPYVIVCCGFMFVLCVGELDSTVLVSPPGETTLAVRLFTLMHYGPDAYVAALSLLTVGLIVLVSALTVAGYARLRTAYNVRD